MVHSAKVMNKSLISCDSFLTLLLFSLRQLNNIGAMEVLSIKRFFVEVGGPNSTSSLSSITWCSIMHAYDRHHCTVPRAAVDECVQESHR